MSASGLVKLSGRNMVSGIRAKSLSAVMSASGLVKLSADTW